MGWEAGRGGGGGGEAGLSLDVPPCCTARCGELCVVPRSVPPRNHIPLTMSAFLITAFRSAILSYLAIQRRGRRADKQRGNEKWWRGVRIDAELSETKAQCRNSINNSEGFIEFKAIVGEFRLGGNAHVYKNVAKWDGTPNGRSI